MKLPPPFARHAFGLNTAALVRRSVSALTDHLDIF